MRMPAIFFGHGNPMNAIERNPVTLAWEELGRDLPRPRAILMVSAHWYVPGTRVDVHEQPPTIHDFGGFPDELYQVQYPAPGDPQLAARVQDLAAPVAIEGDASWGLDHGAWSVLRHVFPLADVPVVQLSIDRRQPAAFHYGLGTRLADLRSEGVLVVGSGNVVHNLHTYAWGRHPVEPYDWALRFEERVRGHIRSGNHEPLIQYRAMGEDALLSVPTPDHYLPLLYVISLAHPGEAITFPVEGVDGGSVSMLSVRIG